MIWDENHKVPVLKRRRSGIKYGSNIFGALHLQEGGELSAILKGSEILHYLFLIEAMTPNGRQGQKRK